MGLQFVFWFVCTRHLVRNQHFTQPQLAYQAVNMATSSPVINMCPTYLPRLDRYLCKRVLYRMPEEFSFDRQRRQPSCTDCRQRQLYQIISKPNCQTQFFFINKRHLFIDKILDLPQNKYTVQIQIWKILHQKLRHSKTACLLFGVSLMVNLTRFGVASILPHNKC